MKWNEMEWNGCSTLVYASMQCSKTHTAQHMVVMLMVVGCGRSWASGLCHTTDDTASLHLMVGRAAHLSSRREGIFSFCALINGCKLVIDPHLSVYEFVCLWCICAAQQIPLAKRKMVNTGKSASIASLRLARQFITFTLKLFGEFVAHTQAEKR